jgi:hypothetical protein
MLALGALSRHQETLEKFDPAIKHKSKLVDAHVNRGAVLACAAATTKRSRAVAG